MASTINDWEASSRYKDNFVALQDDIDNAMVYAENLINYADSKCKCVKDMNSF